jgi:hypothetical protein
MSMSRRRHRRFISFRMRSHPAPKGRYCENTNVQSASIADGCKGKEEQRGTARSGATGSDEMVVFQKEVSSPIDNKATRMDFCFCNPLFPCLDGTQALSLGKGGEARRCVPGRERRADRREHVGETGERREREAEDREGKERSLYDDDEDKRRFFFSIFDLLFLYLRSQKKKPSALSSLQHFNSTKPLPRLPRHPKSNRDPELYRDPPHGTLLPRQPPLPSFSSSFSPDPAAADAGKLGEAGPAAVALREPPGDPTDVAGS